MKKTKKKITVYIDEEQHNQLIEMYTTSLKKGYKPTYSGIISKSIDVRYQCLNNAKEYNEK